jgi:hypothetical protein
LFGFVKALALNSVWTPLSTSSPVSGILSRNISDYYYYYYYYYYWYLLTAIGLTPGGSSPTLVQIKIKIHKTTKNYNKKITTKT